APDRTPQIGKGRAGTTGTPGVSGTKSSGKVSTAQVSNWRDVRRSDPNGTKSREILVATQAAGRGLETGVGVASGLIGGVSGSPFGGGHGLDTTWVNDPWGCNHWSTSCSFWWSSCSWGFGCAWWYPCFWGWYYPCWWWYSQPYYYADYCYYRPVTSVV